MAAFLGALVAGPASAATFTAACSGTTGDVTSLSSAINSANGLTGADTVQLGQGCVYTLTAPDNYWYGPNGLPPISSTITIEGSGATIARAASAPKFRLFFVGADPTSTSTQDYASPAAGIPGGGRLTVRNVTLTGGLAKGGDSNGGGGGAGMGGAIFNQGTLVIDHSTLTGNTARGGSAVNGAAGAAGGGIGSDSSGSSGGGFGAGSFPGGTGGNPLNAAGGGGAGFRTTENGNSATNGGPGTGGGPQTGLGGDGSDTSVAAGDGSGGAGFGTGGSGGPGGNFGGGGVNGGGGGVGGGGSVDGGGGFGGGGGGLPGDGGGGGFGGGGGPGGTGGALPGFGGGTPTSTLGGGGAGMGGAIFNMQGQLTINDSTLAGNEALGGADSVTNHAKGIAGAVFNLSGTFTATNSTFATNTAAYYAAQIYNLVYDAQQARMAQTTLIDTIVAAGSGPADLASDKTSAITPQPNLGSANADLSQFDLVSAFAPLGQGTITGSPLTSDPLLGSLQDNGGATQTMAPGSGSPVIDAASSGCLSTDQRGDPRPDNGEAACDIGAFEVQDPAVTPVAGSNGGTLAAGVGKETLSPRAFPAAPSGPSVIAAKRHRRYGTNVSYTLNEAASVKFTVVQRQAGRRGRGGRCVKPTRSNRRARKCSRVVVLRGSFTRAGTTGVNRFRFTGRLAAHKLKPGSYQLVATPTAAGKTGRAASASFRIIK